MTAQTKTIGILKETRPYETRVPLIPQDLAQILRQPWAKSVRFLVQSSATRAYTDREFVAAGASLQDDLSESDVIMAVKEVPVNSLLPGKTYLCFAHVIKGQPENMPLLRAFLEQKITLIDYELITDPQGRRLVFFGRSAGQVGMFETLRALGLRLQEQGKSCLFQKLKPIYNYRDLAEAKKHLSQLGEALKHEPKLLGITDYPVVFAFTGLGNVGKGALEIFDLLPVQEVLPQELLTLEQKENNSPGILYKVLFEREDTLRNRQKLFDLEQYLANPPNYHSIFPTYLPYISVLVNCVYWKPGQPQLLSAEELKQAWKSGNRRLQVVGDISCDPPDGSLACTVKAVDLHHPTYTYYPNNGNISDDYNSEGITVLAVANLPTGIPRDASAAFSQMLKSFIQDLINADYHDADLFSELPPPVAQAVITHQGRLMPNYEYLQEYLSVTSSSF
jgi:alpha-aminoadipic semialdehyde synthase